MGGRTPMRLVVTALAVMSAWHPGSAAQVPRPACVLLPVESRNVTTGSRGNGSVSYTCVFDASAVTLTCTNKGMSGPMSVSVVTSYPSKDDLIDTVSAIPPLTKSASLRLTGPGPGTSTVYAYDGQKRLLREVATAAMGVTVTSEYSDWDTRGRPRAARITTTPPRPPSDQAIVYDDSARTKTITTNQNGRVVDRHVVTFDANGNQTKDVGTDPGGASYASTTTIISTTKVCR